MNKLDSQFIVCLYSQLLCIDKVRKLTGHEKWPEFMQQRLLVHKTLSYISQHLFFRLCLLS